MAAWYYARDGQQIGPYETADLQQLVASGTVRGDDLVWTDGMVDWQPAGQVPFLAQSAPAYTPAPAAPAYAPPPAGYPAAGYVAPSAGGYPQQPYAGQPHHGQAYPAQASQLGYATPPSHPYPNYGLGYGGYTNYDNPHASMARTARLLAFISFAIGTILLGTVALIMGIIALRGMKRTGNYLNKGSAQTAVGIGCFWWAVVVVVIVAIALSH